MNTATERSGFALPAALLAIVIVGALVTGGVYTAMEEDRSSGSVQFGNHAFLAAERGLQDVLGTKDRPWFQNMGAVGTSAVIGPVALEVLGVQAQYTVTVHRLNTRLFKVDSEGEVLGGGRYAGSKRTLSEMMRITYTLVPKDRALMTQDGMRMRGQSTISGTDSIPDTWDGCTSEGTRTGILAKEDADIDVQKTGGSNVGVTGNPAIAEDATMDSASFIEYGDMHLDDLKAMADKVYTPATYSGMAPAVDGSGACDETVMSNWGDPNNATGACHFYWPIIYFKGDGTTKLTTGSGQGIIIVDGDLHLSGNFEFAGLIFVYGSLTTSGQGNKVAGSMNVLGSSATESSMDDPDSGPGSVGNSRLVLSSCAIERAHLYNERFNRPIPLAVRRFIDLSGIGAS